MLIIDCRMRDFEKEKLKSLGYTLFELDYDNNLYNEISCHVDINCCNIKNTLIVNPNINLEHSIKGYTILSSKYPYDIAYNICILGNKAIHNFKYTDPKILDILEKYNYKKININQGYSKCSIAVIDENSVIVTDKTIAKILVNYDIEVLYIENFDNKKINLYKNKNLEISNMHGFIGGVISRIDDFIFVSGDLKLIDKTNIIRNFIESKNLKIIDFPNKDIIDYGGIIKTEKTLK